MRTTISARCWRDRGESGPRPKAAFARLCACDPARAKRHGNLGRRCVPRDRWEPRTISFGAAAAAALTMRFCSPVLGAALRASGRLREAEAATRRALALVPARAYTRIELLAMSRRTRGLGIRRTRPFRRSASLRTTRIPRAPPRPRLRVHRYRARGFRRGRRRSAARGIAAAAVRICGGTQRALAISCSIAVASRNPKARFSRRCVFRRTIHERAIPAYQAFAWQARASRRVASASNNRFGRMPGATANTISSRRPPCWQGSGLAGVRLLIHADHGLGRRHQFSR